MERRSGAPNDGFLPNALKRCFRLSRVLLKLCRLIPSLGCTIKFLSVRSFLGNCSLPEFIRAFFPFPENLSSYSFSENPSWPIFVPKTSFLSLRKQKASIKKAPDDISLTENLRRQQVFLTDIPPKRSVGCPWKIIAVIDITFAVVKRKPEKKKKKKKKKQKQACTGFEPYDVCDSGAAL